MATGDDFSDLRYAGRDERRLKIAPNVARWNRIVRNKATFCRYHDLVTIESPRCELFQGSADGAFASLAAVVNGGVDDITARFDGANDRIVVELVSLRIVIAEISADADGREPQSLRLAKMSGRNLALETLAIALC